MAALDFTTRLPIDLANIVRGYLSIFTRPFKNSHCVACGTKHRRTKTNLCDEHANLCPFCFGYLPKHKGKGWDLPYCVDCFQKHTWLKGMEIPTRGLWERLYHIAETPDLMMADLKQSYDTLKANRDKWESDVNEYQKILEGFKSLSTIRPLDRGEDAAQGVMQAKMQLLKWNTPPPLCFRFLCADRSEGNVYLNVFT